MHKQTDLKTAKHILYLRTDIGCVDIIGGGSVAHTQGVLKGFLTDGYKVICASSAMHALLDLFERQEREHSRFIIEKLYTPRIAQLCGFKLNALCSNAFFYRRVASLCKTYPVNFVYQRYSMLNATGVSIAWQHKLPLILEYNGSEVWVDEHWAYKRRLRMGPLVRWFEQLNLTHATLIVVVSQELKQQLLDRGIAERKILINPNGVDVHCFNPIHFKDIRELKRASLGFTDGYVFGFSGTFSQWHGVDMLIDLMIALCKQEPRARFLLIGDGPLLKQVRQAVYEHNITVRVHMTGMMSNDQMPVWLSVCDAFLCLNQPNPDGTPFFGSPTKLFEYMAMGKPILATRVGQVERILSKFEEQCLVMPSDISALIHTARVIMHMDHDTVRLLSLKLRLCAQNNYSWKAHTARVMQKFSELCSEMQ